jgi:hypothetical protein
MEKPIEFNGLCAECLDELEEIELDKLAAGEQLQPTEDETK